MTPKPPVTLSLKQARRIALAAQGMKPRRERRIGRPHVEKTLGRLGLVQIDSVNVLVRSHYLPLFSRLGSYDTDHLDRLAYGRRRAVFEYWGHEASLIPLSLHPLFRWRMADAEAGRGIYSGLAKFGRERRGYIDEVLAEIADRGPLSASDLSNGGRSKGSWWGWSEGKGAVEWLFWAGRVTTASRRNFERVYDLPERVLPASVVDAPTPPREEAIRELLRIAIRALGIATAADLRDYFRLKPADADPRIAELVEAGDLVPAAVEGWRQKAYLDPAAAMPRRVAAQALLSPFDSLVWERGRTERLFGCEFRLEIYTPPEKRRYGYYVLPFLLGEAIAARVDLKADRKNAQLLVQAAHAEPGATPDEVAAPLAAELGQLAAWLGLEGVAVSGKGDLAPALRRACG